MAFSGKDHLLLTLLNWGFHKKFKELFLETTYLFPDRDNPTFIARIYSSMAL